MKKKLLAGFMTLCMLLSLLPTAVFAVETEAEPSTEQTVSDPVDVVTQTERSGDKSEPMQTTVGEIDTAEALQQAINVAPDGVQTDIILTDGFSIDTVITIPEGKEISFDLNGKTLTVTENFTGRPFKIEGTLIVEGDGTIDTTSAKETYGVFDNYGVLTVLNGTYKSYLYAGGAVIKNRPGSQCTIRNGAYYGSPTAVYNEGITKIYGGTFEGRSCSSCDNKNWGYTIQSHWTDKSAAKPELYFYDGKVIGVQGAFSTSAGYSEIRGGTFTTVSCETHSGGNSAFYAAYIAGESGEVEAHIYDGIFTACTKQALFVGNSGDGGEKKSAIVFVHDGTFVSQASGQPAVYVDNPLGGLEIYEGKFSSNEVKTNPKNKQLSDYTNPSSKVEESDGSFIVVPLTAENSVAEVGGKYYATLPDAIAAAKTGDTVKLVKDITSSSTIQISQKTDIKLDLNGKKLTVTSGDALLNNGALTILDSLSGGKIISEKSGTIGVGSNSTTTIQSGEFESVEGAVFTGLSTGATITIEGGTFSASDNAVIAGNGSNRTGDPNVINIKGGTFNGSIKTAGYVACGIYAPWKDQITVSGGTFNITGGAGIVARGGTITVTGGEFKTTGNVTGKVGDSRVVVPCAALVFDSAAKYPGMTETSKIAVSGGTFTSDSGVNAVQTVADDPADTSRVSIIGGTFSSDPKSYISTGYTAKENTPSEGLWTVEASNGMVADVEKPAGGTSASATVGGNFSVNQGETGTEGDGQVKPESGSVTVNVATGEAGAPDESVKQVTVSVDNNALTSVQSAKVDVDIVTDVGTVTLDKDAWTTITDNADGGSVALTVEEKSGGGWTVSAVNASGDPVFSAEDDSRKGEITVSVPYTPAQELAQGDKVVVYYVSEDGQLESMTTTYEAGTLSWTTDHLSDFIGVIIGADDEAVWVSGSSIQTGKLADALADSNLAGGNIYLVKDAALDSAEFTISKNITILKDENAAAVPAITATVAAGPTTGAFTITENAALTLNGVKLTVKGTADTEGKGGNYDGTGFILNNSANGNGGKLILNNAEVELTGLQRGMVFQVAAANLASVEMTNSKLTIQNIDGNASNGGVWNIKDHSTLTVNGCGDYGLSVQDITVDNSTVNVTNVDKTGVVAQDVTVSGGGSISVTNSGKELPCKDWQGNDMNAVVELKSDGSLTVDENSKLTASGNKDKDGKPVDKIDINGGTLDNKGAITGEIVTTAPAGSHTVKVVVNGQVIDIQTVTNGDSFTLPAAPAGGNFQGWYDGTTVHAAGATVTITADVTFTASWYTSGGGGGGGSSSYSISVDKNIENGTVTVSPKSASSGRTVTITVKPDEGYELDELTVTDKNGDEIKLTDKGDGKYTFKMPRSKVTIEASFVEIDHQDTCPAAGFRDVDEDAWYHEAVDYALDNGLMSGVSDREFAPGSTLTRAMVAQMLYSLEGKPAAGSADFADVAEGAWYADAISWAAGEGIVSGYGDTFGPNDPITREQLAAILYRYAQNEGYKTSQSGKGTEGYLDASSISSYAVKAMDWAVNAGLLSGKGNNTLAPTAGATRAEVAQIFMNFCKDIAK